MVVSYNESGIKFSALELHSDNCAAAISDASDRRLLTRRCRNDRDTILAVLAPRNPELSALCRSNQQLLPARRSSDERSFEFKLAITAASRR
jgi:hypothetical protein